MAAGLVPFSLGNDAAGSVRVPAALSGCTGVMASRYRINPQGPSLSLTIGQNGFFTTCIRDAALLHAVISDRGVPPVRLPALQGGRAATEGLRGVRMGVFWPWFDHCEDGVRARCRAAVAVLERCGACLLVCVCCKMVCACGAL